MDTVFIIKAIMIASIGILFFLFVYAKLQKPSEMQKYITIGIVGMMLMLFGTFLEMSSRSLDGAYYGTIMCYMGQPFLIASSLLLICTFYGVRIRKWVEALMMGVAILFTLMVVTNPYHHLYYTAVGFDQYKKYSPLIHVHGPLYALNVALMVVYVMGITFITIRGYRNTKSALKRRLSIYAGLMILSSVVGFILYSIGVGDGFDTTMFGLTAASIFMTLLFFKCRAFDIVDMSKNYALDNSTAGLMIYDDVDNLVYQNDFAQEVLRSINLNNKLFELPEGKKIIKKEPNIYSISVVDIRHKKDYLGKCIEIQDITVSYKYSERLEQAVEEATERIENIQRTIVASFASLVEARSVETGDHIKRVSEYAGMIARNLQKEGKYPEILTDDYINMLVHSAPLHDVGKISIPDAILLKPSKLTTEEFEIMKTHAQLGADIIKNTMEGLETEEYVKMGIDIAAHHHERWDGNGYPDKLKAEEIPLSARIIAVADCYDAMTSERCYKEAFPVVSAMRFIRE